MILGHLAVSALEHRYARLPLAPLMAAALVPDLVDKVAHYVFGQNATSRMWAHTLLAVLISSLIVLTFGGVRNAVGWILGYLSHLICDIGGVVPWFAPFASYQFPPATGFLTALWAGLTQPSILLELALVVWAILALKPRFHRLAGQAQSDLAEHTAKENDRPLRHDGPVPEGG